MCLCIWSLSSLSQCFMPTPPHLWVRGCPKTISPPHPPLLFKPHIKHCFLQYCKQSSYVASQVTIDGLSFQSPSPLNSSVNVLLKAFSLLTPFASQNIFPHVCQFVASRQYRKHPTSYRRPSSTFCTSKVWCGLQCRFIPGWVRVASNVVPNFHDLVCPCLCQTIPQFTCERCTCHACSTI